MPTAQPPASIGVSTYRQTTSWWAWERDAAPGPRARTSTWWRRPAVSPVLIPPPATAPGGPTADDAARSALVAALDGLVLIGGGDIGRRPLRPGRRSPQRRAPNDAAGRPRARPAGRRPRPRPPGAGRLPGPAGAQRGPRAATWSSSCPTCSASVAHQPRPGAFGADRGGDRGRAATVRRLLGERFEVLCCHHQAIGTLGRGSGGHRHAAPTGSSRRSSSPGPASWSACSGIPRRAGDGRLFEALMRAAGDRRRPDGPVAGGRR